ncbi:MAG: DUF1579 domain-containing protein [Bacteroidia bacterium]|nr:DUF1579 domain-containing protein [Bacteroidia bacterium]HQU99651.1 DUF1579 domain-containing protein [Bacteroidia bacterium]
MKKPLITLAACLFAANVLWAQTDAKKPEMSKEEMAAMKAWEAFATPGAVHKMLAKDDGQWDEEITMWYAPGAPPETMKATCVNSMILGGRYQQSVHRGNFQGQPFEGISTLAYDNTRKVFISSWIDNMGTGMMIMEGISKGDNVVAFEGKQTDPVSGKELKMSEEFIMVDANTQRMIMYQTTAEGKTFKNMEITFKRKK